MTDDYPSDWNKRRKLVYRRDNYQCQRCGRRGGSRGNAELHAHHIRPKSKGGSHQLTNLTTVCQQCHSNIHGRPVGRGSSPSSSSTGTPGDGFVAFIVWLMLYMLGGGLFGVAAPWIFVELLDEWLFLTLIFWVIFYLWLKGYSLPWYSGDWWTNVGKRIGERGVILLLIVGNLLGIIGIIGILTKQDSIYSLMCLVAASILLLLLKIMYELSKESEYSESLTEDEWENCKDELKTEDSIIYFCSDCKQVVKRSGWRGVYQHYKHCNIPSERPEPLSEDQWEKIKHELKATDPND